MLGGGEVQTAFICFPMSVRDSIQSHSLPLEPLARVLSSSDAFIKRFFALFFGQHIQNILQIIFYSLAVNLYHRFSVQVNKTTFFNIIIIQSESHSMKESERELNRDHLGMSVVPAHVSLFFS